MIDLTHTKVEEFIMTVQTPYRYDVVGSFLRPAKLKLVKIMSLKKFQEKN